MTTQNNQIPTTTRPIVRSRRCWLDIWESRETIRIYIDRTVHRHPCRNYCNANSWGLGERADRYTGKLHQCLLSIIEQERTDGEDYTERMFEALSDPT